MATYWHRARYGWAPRDTWSLDLYLNSVLGGALDHLATHSGGAPTGYGVDAPEGYDVDGNLDTTNFAQWEADLRRWAAAFREAAEDVTIYDAPTYERQQAEERRRRENLHTALREIEPWWDALWD